MPATITQVKALMPADVILSDAKIEMGVITASCHLENNPSCTEGLSEQCAQAVCAYLTLHFLSFTDRTLIVKSESDKCSGSASYQLPNPSDGVKATWWGQQANTLTNGCLADAEKMKPQIYAIGGGCS